jgi:hypothetical protein
MQFYVRKQLPTRFDRGSDLFDNRQVVYGHQNLL